MMERITPIFLLSLPRSGSTVLQRILSSHSEISTVSEPWLLLPPLYALRTSGVRSEYSHLHLSRAINDFCSSLPDGAASYRQAAKEMALSLYSQAADPGSRYFLDKTPRYHLIADELLESFGEARFILLWRNPLAVVASMLETWHSGKWLPYRLEIDLYRGIEMLTEVAARSGGQMARSGGQIHTVRFEDLVARPDDLIEDICRYLDLSPQPDMAAGLKSKQLSGQMGDPATDESYAEVSSEPLAKWKQILASPIRKSWGRRYLRWIGRERLHLMGYDLDEILMELKAAPVRVDTLAADILRTCHGFFLRAFGSDFFD